MYLCQEKACMQLKILTVELSHLKIHLEDTKIWFKWQLQVDVIRIIHLILYNFLDYTVCNAMVSVKHFMTAQRCVHSQLIPMKQELLLNKTTQYLVILNVNTL